jgi:hypothetical protein
MKRCQEIVWVLLMLLAAADANGARFRVCAFSFNRPDEIDVFKSLLPGEDFEVTDLVPHPPLPAGASANGKVSWLTNLCRPDLRCDVAVYSAEFAGHFFGAYGVSLGLQDMEEASCQTRCDGLFHHPREVFLLACNTLATKDEDRRTPEDYLRVLLEHGFDRASAERVVAMRYGPLGPSFREALRRIFMGVPRLYGFSSVAPSGEYAAPLLERYFRSKGDYRQYLERTGWDTAPNRELLAAFRGADFVQVPGLSASEPAAADREAVCRLYDESRSVAERLGTVQRLLERQDFLAFLPGIEAFVGRHPAEDLQGEARGRFAAIRRNETARDEVLRLVHELDVSALQMELAHLAVHLEWMTHAEFRALALDAARRLVGRPLTSEVVDIMCEIPKHEPIGDAFRSEDLPDALFHDPEGIRFVDCLSPADPHVSARLVPALDGPDPAARLWASYALSRRLPLDDALLIRLTAHLSDPDLRDRLRWIFMVQPRLSPAVRRAVAAHDPELADELRARRR